MKLLLNIDETAMYPWVKYNTQEEWDNHIKAMLPYASPRRDPEHFPCYSKEICTINANGRDEGNIPLTIFCFEYDFFEMELAAPIETKEKVCSIPTFFH